MSVPRLILSEIAHPKGRIFVALLPSGSLDDAVASSAEISALGIVHVPVSYRFSLFEFLGILLIVLMVVVTAYTVFTSGRKENL